MAGRVVVNMPAVERATRSLLRAIGENPDREGLKDTPARVARAWTEFIERPSPQLTSFSPASTDQMVVVKGMRVWSMCEHHLLPFWCDVAVGYIATDRVLGLSKFGRIAAHVAGRLQLQERIAEQIAAEVELGTGSPDVAVLCEGEHLCMAMRGAKLPHRMVSSVMRGRFLDDASCRREFLELSVSR